MSLSIGIVGLPNVGKSTVFNALTKTQMARVASFPFSTVEPNRAVVPVPDKRLSRLQALIAVPEKIYTTIEFVDIAGLVTGANHGEGLGNQFLGHIRNADAILHVVRCFEDENVSHIALTLDPERDIGIIQTELGLADLQQLEKVIERLTRQIKGERKYQPQLETALALQAELDGGHPLNQYSGKQSDAFRSLNQELRLLSAKPMVFVANVGEADLESDSECVLVVERISRQSHSPFVKIGAAFEEQLAGLPEDERQEFLSLVGAKESALDQVIRIGYETLGLISFFTMNEKEVRAWTIPRGWTAVQAAGAIHTDFERGFIRAEVLPFAVFEEFGSVAAARSAGVLQVEGRDYIVSDGDILYFRFNV
jgi:ribosome-binding ATPase